MKNLARSPLAAAVCAALVLCGCGRDTRRASASATAPANAKQAESRPETAKRPYFRYSVVSGGVHSPQEARERAAGDPVVNRHYEGINMSRLRPRINEDDRDVYVSYRVGNEVYWTKKPVRLRRNEVVLTDGHEEIRTRCGNRISLVPMGPVHPDAEPNADVFDTKVDKADAEWPDAVTYADAMPLGGVLTSVPLMPNWSSNSVPPPANLGMPPGMLATQAPAPAPIGGGGTPGGGGGGGTPIVPVNTDGATIFNNWGGSVGSGLILVNQTGQNGPPGGFVINNVVNNNNGGVTVYNNNQGGNTSSNTATNTNNQILTTALYQTQTIQNFTQLTTSNQQIVNNNSSNTTTNNNSSTTNNNTTNVTNHNETNNSSYYNSSSSVTNFYNNITNITNIINNCCCDGDTPDTSVPEPATFMLFGASLGALWLYARLRRRFARRR